MNHFEKIEAYLSNEMNAEERTAFEALVEQDASLKKDLNEWIATDSIVGKQEAAAAHIPALTHTLTPLTQQYFGAAATITKGKIVAFKKYIAAAVAIAALLIIYFLNPSSIDTYTINPMPGAVVRGEVDAGKIGAQLFNEGKYDTALPYLQKNALAHPQDATAQYYYGIALLKTKQPDSAFVVFEKLTQGTSVYKEDSYFFAALSAYKLGNNQNAVSFAGKVSVDNMYYNHAKNILKKAK